MKLDIKTFRKEQGFTQQELADKSAVSPAAINHYENGMKLPSLQAAYNIARALGVKIDDLIVE
ncbi:MAG: helix-turn-helix transcriptional regulator [Clostridia bacterium]